MNALFKLPPLPAVRRDYLDFEKGVDEVTPKWKAKPGSLQSASNFEIGLDGGYVDIEGYERFDGQTAPSAATYILLDVTITGSFNGGDTVTGADTGATGVIVAGGVVTSGAQDYLILTKTTGTFSNASENLTVSAVIQGNTDAVGIPNGASTQNLQAQYKNLAADVYRSDITVVPGTGDMLGVWVFNDIVYAFRNAVGGATAAIYKSTASGWAAVALGKELSFTSGSTAIAESDVITGLTGGATATITRVMVESGSWAGGDAAGRLIFASQTGTFQSEGIEVSGGGDLATIAGDSSAITLSPSGDYEFVNSNFGSGYRMYGVDGVNRGFEFDGTVFCPIDTGMGNQSGFSDAPNHVTEHKDHLFYSFNHSVQHSAIGDPYNFEPVLGAAEIATSDLVSNFAIQPGSEGNATLLILNDNVAYMLYGNSSLDWNLVQYRDEIGGYKDSAQVMGQTYFMGEYGVTTIKTTQSFGNFRDATITDQIRDTVNAKKLLITASVISRNKNQYRIFFSDKTGLYITILNNKPVGVMPISFDDEVICSCSVETNSGDEAMYFGSDNGFVYQMDKGTSFDGSDIDAFYVTHFYHANSLRMKKRWMTATWEAQGEGYAQFSYSYSLDYGSASTVQPQSVTVDSTVTGGSSWDEFVWDSFTWDQTDLSPVTVRLAGSSENISLTVSKSSDYMKPVDYSGVFFRFYPTGRQKRS